MVRATWLAVAFVGVAFIVVVIGCLFELILWVSPGAPRLYGLAISDDGRLVYVSHVVTMPHARRNNHQPPVTVSVAELSEDSSVFVPLLTDGGEKLPEKITTDFLRDELAWSSNSLLFGTSVYRFAEDHRRLKKGFLFLDRTTIADEGDWGHASLMNLGDLLIFSPPWHPNRPERPTEIYDIDDRGLSKVILSADKPDYSVIGASDSTRLVMWHRENRNRLWYDARTKNVLPIWKEDGSEKINISSGGIWDDYYIQSMTTDSRYWLLKKGNQLYTLCLPDDGEEPFSLKEISPCPLDAVVSNSRHRNPAILNREFVVLQEENNRLSVYSMLNGNKIWASSEGHNYQRLMASVSGPIFVGSCYQSATVWRWDGKVAEPWYQIYIDINGKARIYPSKTAPKESIDDGFSAQQPISNE